MGHVTGTALRCPPARRMATLWRAAGRARAFQWTWRALSGNMRTSQTLSLRTMALSAVSLCALSPGHDAVMCACRHVGRRRARVVHDPVRRDSRRAAHCPVPPDRAPWELDQHVRRAPLRRPPGDAGRMVRRAHARTLRRVRRVCDGARRGTRRCAAPMWWVGSPYLPPTRTHAHARARRPRRTGRRRACRRRRPPRSSLMS